MMNLNREQFKQAFFSDEVQLTIRLAVESDQVFNQAQMEAIMAIERFLTSPGDPKIEKAIAIGKELFAEKNMQPIKPYPLVEYYHQSMTWNQAYQAEKERHGKPTIN